MVANTAAGQPFITSVPEPINGMETPFVARSNPTTSYILPPNNVAHANSSAKRNYVYEKQYPMNSMKRHQILYRAQTNPPKTRNGASLPIIKTNRIV